MAIATRVAYPTTGGAAAHALFYPPRNRRHVGPDGELPPLAVMTHGGPTGHASPRLSPDVAFLAERGTVDPQWMTIESGSAGGFTTLACLVRSDKPFAAGADFFGVADLVLLAEHSHTSESRYVDSLIGPYPQARELYVQRSPLSHVDQVTTPVIVLQGLEDEIVPPEPSEAIATAARDRGVSVVLLGRPG